MQILVAEDDKGSAKAIRRVLETWGHQVLMAEDGCQAWEIFQKGNIRMVITDWLMPNLDGLTLCRNIRKTSVSPYVYIILLTAKNLKEDTVAGLEAGADDYIVKPFEHEELRARLRAGQRILELEDEREKTYQKLLQSEKMASIGQLAAGVAHEINNPIGFVSSNLSTLAEYERDIRDLVAQYRELINSLRQFTAAEGFEGPLSDKLSRVGDFEHEIDIDYISEDTAKLVQECHEGVERIKKIVADLKDFAHPGNHTPEFTDINQNLSSTLNVVWNELKFKAKVVKEFGELPLVRCLPHQLNQVFMNLLVNASQAIEKEGEIRITTSRTEGQVEISISDTGIGIPEENLSRIFEPFFTTKEVGQGTGLGLNVAYNIIENHKGTINVKSELGKGTTFTIRLPLQDDGHL